MFSVKTAIIGIFLILFGIFLLTVFIISISMFCSARKNSDINMSFKQFRRFYNLSPNRWRCYDDEYIMESTAYVKRDGNGVTREKVSVSMKTYFDFWCLVIWQWKINKAEEKEENLRKEINGLKTLSSIINKEAEEIQKRTQEEIKKLAKKIEEIQSNS